MNTREARRIVRMLNMSDSDKQRVLSLPPKYLVAWVTMARLDKRGS